MNLIGDLEYVYMCVLTEFDNLFAEIISEMGAILILVLVSQTKKLVFNLAIAATQLSLPKILVSLVVMVVSKPSFCFFQSSLDKRIGEMLSIYSC